MAGELKAKVLVTGRTNYYAVIQLGPLFLSGATPETRNDAHWGAYKVALAESSLLGEYVGNAPAGLAPGSYSFDCYQQAGGSASPNDMEVATGGGFTIAAVPTPASSYTATPGATAITLGQSVRVWYQLDHPLTGSASLVITPSDSLAATASPSVATIAPGQSVASLVITPTVIGAHNLTSTVSGGPGGIANQSTPVGLTVAAASSGGGIGDVEVEDGITIPQSLALMLAALTGKVTGVDTNNPRFMAPDGTTERIVAHTDSVGNRTSRTLNPPV